jgi:NADH-quinone oxidoreductase subunit N
VSANLLIGLSPLLMVIGGALTLMMIEALSRFRDAQSESPSASLATASTVVLGCAMVASAAVWIVGPDRLPEVHALAPYLIIDRFSLFFFAVLLLGAMLSVMLAGAYLPEHGLDRGEFYPLILLSTAGAMALAASGDLISLFISLESMSLGVYALAAMRRSSPRSVEAATKYFLLGSFASALLLYGSALLYGASGRTDLGSIGSQLLRTGFSNPQNAEQLSYETAVPLVMVGMVLVLVGLAFKISAVPFHMWTPDAYEGAPTPVTSYMAAVVKTAAFAVLLRVLAVAFGDGRSASWAAGWPPILAALAVATMTVANLIAARQSSVKRMLAYSSIAHAGYMLIGVIAMTRLPKEGGSSVLFYALAYTVSTVGAFGTLILCGSRGAEAVSYEDLAGLGRRHPAVALAFSLFVLSLAGVPPTAGFFAKLQLFRAAVDGGYVWLTLIGLVNSVIAAYYYLRVLVTLYMREPMPGAPIAKPMRSVAVWVALIVAALLVLGLGLLPGRALGAAWAASLTRG